MKSEDHPENRGEKRKRGNIGTLRKMWVGLCSLVRKGNGKTRARGERSKLQEKGIGKREIT